MNHDIILKVILQLRKSEVKMGSRRHSFLRWSENPRQGRGGGWMRFEQGSDWRRDSSRRYQFDETLNNAIHGETSTELIGLTECDNKRVKRL